MQDKKILNILMADDDEDDRYFFNEALKKMPMSASLITVDDGQELTEYLSANKTALPDILFLDINMPRKNGYECLLEIKSDPYLKDLPVIMYSTSLKDAMADMLYQNGAHYYLRKGDVAELAKYLKFVLTRLRKHDFKKPSREEFVLNEMRVI